MSYTSIANHFHGNHEYKSIEWNFVEIGLGLLAVSTIFMEVGLSLLTVSRVLFWYSYSKFGQEFRSNAVRWNALLKKKKLRRLGSRYYGELLQAYASAGLRYRDEASFSSSFKPLFEKSSRKSDIERKLYPWSAICEKTRRKSRDSRNPNERPTLPP